MQKVLIYSKGSEAGSASNALNLKCKSVTVTPDARLTNAPVETGVYINDCKVRQPTTITMQVVLEVKDTSWIGVIEQLRALHQSFTQGKTMQATRNELAVVQTKEGIYFNMVLLNCPHTEGVENFSTFEFHLKLQELILTGGDAINAVKSPTDTRPVNGGQK